MPASRVFLLLALTTVLVLVAVVAPGWAVAVLALDLAILAAFAIDLVRVRGISLAARRQWPAILAQGADAEVRLEIANRGQRAVEVRLREALHPALAEAPRTTRLALPGGGRAEWSYPIRPRRRGEHTAGPLMARVLGPWRLAWSQQQVLPPEPQRVYPRVRWDGKVGRLLLLAHRGALGRNPQRLEGVGSELYALREYLPGDPPNKVSWKATARHGRLVSREETWERGARLIVLLDCGRGMSGQDGERSKLDHALAGALALTRVAASRGDTVTLIAFSDRIERSVRIHAGRRSIHAAYGAVYDLEARLSEPAFDLAADTAGATESRRSTVVVLTSVVDLAAAELLKEAVLRLERRHHPILVNLQDPELVSLAIGEPAGEQGGEPPSPEDVFARVAALDILLANRRLATRLRHAGVRVVNTSADRLALETLEAYLAMFKARGAR